MLSQLVGEYLLLSCPEVDISAALSIMPYTTSKSVVYSLEYDRLPMEIGWRDDDSHQSLGPSLTHEIYLACGSVYLPICRQVWKSIPPDLSSTSVEHAIPPKEDKIIQWFNFTKHRRQCADREISSSRKRMHHPPYYGNLQSLMKGKGLGYGFTLFLNFSHVKIPDISVLIIFCFF